MAFFALRSHLGRHVAVRIALLVAPLVAGGCESSVTDATTGGGGEGGAPTTSSTATPSTTDTSVTTTTTDTPSTTTTDTPTTTAQGGGGSGGAMTGGGGAGGGVVDPWAGPIESLKELDLGTVGFGVQQQFPIPDKTLGFTVQAEASTLDGIVGIYRLRPPVGTSVIINFAMQGHDNQVFGGQGFIAAADPQSDSADAFPVKAGAWKVTLGSDGESGENAAVRVWVRRTADGAFHGGVVDVNLFITPGSASTTYMNQVLNAFFPYVGLTKGTVNTYSADSSFSTVNSRDEYREMLAATAGVPSAPVINLFVVDDFADSDFGGAIGVAGGIPGSPMRNGTTQSGVAYEPTGDTGYDATILMHEIGHLGGLFHTTEFQIQETDPLSDTAECAPDTIANNPNACPDNSNVMFPMAYGATTFSTGQTNVLVGSALYRGILEQGGSPSSPLALVPPPDAPSLMPFADPFAGALASAAAKALALEPASRTMPRAPDALERILGALWCSHDASGLALSIARDGAVTLSRDAAAKGSPATGAAAAKAPSASRRLRAIFVDEAAPMLLRKRAMKLYLAAARDEGIGAEAIETLLGIARRSNAVSIPERRLRSTALRLVRDARLAPAGGASSSVSTRLASRIDAALAAALASTDPLAVAAASGN